jgi:UDP-N-acetylglucosamine 2-epimerase (non-hydrolysing)
VDERANFIEILEGLRELAASWQILFPAHPRTQKQIRELGLEPVLSGSNGSPGIQMIDPQGYLDFLCLMKHARLVATDSGGVQEETTALRVPCVTLRDNTERPVTIECGTNILGGTNRQSIVTAIRKQLSRRPRTEVPELWDGRAASRIVGILAERLMHNSHVPVRSESPDALALSASASGQI